MTRIIGTGTIRGKTYTSKKPYEVDLAPVEEYISKLDQALGTEQNVRERKFVELTTYFLQAIRKMKKEQLEYLANELQSRLERMASLYQTTLDEPEEHLKQVKEYRKLEKLIKENIPPDIMEAVKMYERARDALDKAKQELPSMLEEKIS
jgi:hypothetical protein